MSAKDSFRKRKGAFLGRKVCVWVIYCVANYWDSHYGLRASWGGWGGSGYNLNYTLFVLIFCYFVIN